MAEKPMKISIVIPTYEMRGKGVAYLRYNIDRILSQTFVYYEVIVSDHSVGDDIKLLVDSYGDNRLVYARNTENRGNSSANMNFGITHTTGEVIKPMFQDDFFYSDKALAIIHNTFLKGCRWMAIASNVTENRTKYYYDFIPKWNDNIVYGNNTISGPSCIAFRKDCNVRFDERLVWLMDCKLYRDLYDKFGLPDIEEQVLVTNFKHPDQFTNLIPNVRKQTEVDLMKKEYMKTKILITGAAGFIGSHLCERLLNDGHQVIGVDNLSLGVNKIPKHVMSNRNFRFYRADILDEKLFDEVFIQQPCIKSVFHLAGNSMIREESANIDIRNTLNSTLAVLEKCHKYGIEEFIFASTGAVYGEAGVVLNENHGALLPISHYAAAKLSSEAFISSYSWMYGIRAWICRFPNVTGDHATHGVVAGFMKQIRENPRELKVWGDGTQSKAYMYVKDLIDAVIFVWLNAKDRFNYFNISGGGEATVKEIAEMVVRKMGTNTKIVYQDSSRGWVGDVPQYRCDISKLLSLGYKSPRNSLEAVELAIEKLYNENFVHLL